MPDTEYPFEVWKFPMPLGPFEPRECMVPVGAKVLHVAAQGDCPMVWMQVDPGASQAPMTFKVVGTGHREIAESDEYLGSALTHGGAYVWHIYRENDPYGL